MNNCNLINHCNLNKYLPYVRLSCCLYSNKLDKTKKSTRNPKTQPPSYYDSTFQCLWHNYFLTKDDDLKVDSDQC